MDVVLSVIGVGLLIGLLYAVFSVAKTKEEGIVPEDGYPYEVHLENSEGRWTLRVTKRYGSGYWSKEPQDWLVFGEDFTEKGTWTYDFRPVDMSGQGDSIVVAEGKGEAVFGYVDMGFSGIDLLPKYGEVTAVSVSPKGDSK